MTLTNTCSSRWHCLYTCFEKPMQSQHVVPVYKNIWTFVYLEFQKWKKGLLRLPKGSGHWMLLNHQSKEFLMIIAYQHALDFLQCWRIKQLLNFATCQHGLQIILWVSWCEWKVIHTDTVKYDNKCYCKVDIKLILWYNSCSKEWYL